ncbi:MAG TPA: MFS transporter [Phycisphaerales bacterium]|nr:MFS transporter [Phycisphaerales bacterium]
MSMLRRLNPFRSLPNAKQVFAWGMYDLANQSFTLLIITLYFAIDFDRVIASTPEQGEQLRNLSFAGASLVVVIISPILGAVADFTGKKKLALNWTCLGCSLGMIALAFTGPGNIWFAMLVYAFANICFMCGENFLAAFLPEISTRENIGTVSAIGWTMGYAGALLCLPLSLLIPGMAQEGGPTPGAFRAVFVFSGVWFLLGAVPTLIWLKEQKAPEKLAPGETLLTVGFVRLASTAKQVGHFRELAKFLVFFLIYCCGMQIVIANAGVIAERYMQGVELVFFIWVLAAVSGAGSVLGGIAQHRRGLKVTIVASLTVWILTALGAAALPTTDAHRWHLWLVGIGMGLGLGMTGTASRALVGVFTPRQRTAEFFSFWGLGYKVAGVVGPFLYAWVVGSSPNGQRDGMLLVAATFVIGLVGVLFVRLHRGRAAAEEDEQRHATRP